jgi:hypothetical protein
MAFNSLPTCLRLIVEKLELHWHHVGPTVVIQDSQKLN